MKELKDPQKDLQKKQSPEKKEKEESEEFKKEKELFLNKRKKERRQKYIAFCILWILFFFVSFVALATFYFAQEKTSIKNLTVSGYKHITPIEIEQGIVPFLNQKFLGVVPVNNKTFFREKAITEYFLKKYRGINSITFQFTGNNKLKVTLNEKNINALLCQRNNAAGSKDLDINSEDCYYLDLESRAYQKAPRVSDGLYIKYYVEKELYQSITQSKKEFMKLSDFLIIEEVVYFLKNLDIEVDSINVSNEKNSFSFHVYRVDQWYPENFLIKFSSQTLSSPLKDITLYGFEKIWKTNSEKKERLHSLEYIDMRFDRKALSKHYENEQEESKF